MERSDDNPSAVASAPALPERRGKWIEGLTPSTPALDAAGAVLRLRFEDAVAWRDAAVRDDLTAEQSVTTIHQLRVATRRASAAIRSFRSILDEGDARNASRRLRRIRRAAGDARDADVQSEAFAELADEGCALGVGYLISALARARRSASSRVQKRLQSKDGDGLSQVSERLLDRIKKGDDARGGVLLDLARRTVRDLTESARITARSDLHHLPNCHALRIDGKRLRYAMEVFACCFESGAIDDGVYQQITALQDRLGALNDLHERRLRLGSLRAEGPIGSLPVGVRRALEASFDALDAR
ncbi:MAG: CHAD domain-containing protein, partial [Planctomycetota bacterium]